MRETRLSASESDVPITKRGFYPRLRSPVRSSTRGEAPPSVQYLHVAKKARGAVRPRGRMRARAVNQKRMPPLRMSPSRCRGAR